MLYEYIIWVLSIEGLMILSFYLWLKFFKGLNFWKKISNNVSTFQNKMNLTFLLNVLVIGNHFGSLTHNLLNVIIHVCDWLLINTYSTFKKDSIWMRFDFQTLFQSLPTIKMKIYFEMIGLTFLHSFTMLKFQNIFLFCFHYHALFWLWAQG